MATLYLCATPIGNLGEMNSRCIETLKQVDLICAEDTRHTLKLLNHFAIVARKLISYHEHNKDKQHEYILQYLRDGKDVALVSDAGYPGISDPGEELVALAVQEQINVVAINGANAALTALVASGIPTGRFYFAGFLPKTKKHRIQDIERLKEIDITLILYEAPHRLAEILSDLLAGLGDRKIAVARELTKLHEEFFRGRISEALAWLAEQPPRGEFVLVIASAAFSGLEQVVQEVDEQTLLDSVPVMLEKMMTDGLDKKSAIAALAKKLNLPKKKVYNAALEDR